MITFLSAALLAAPAHAGAADSGRFSVGLPAEVSLVGLAFGVHPELLFRPLRPDGALHLRGAVGASVGPELAALPVSIGVREVFFPTRAVRPGVGIGAQLQTFLPREHSAYVRLDQYLELTLDVSVTEAWRAGIQLSPQFGMTPGFGLGMAARVGVQRDLPW